MYNMFGELQESAARIESEIGTLESKLPEVMYGYTDANPDPQPIFDRRTREIKNDIIGMRSFLDEVAAFEKLINENAEAVCEEEDFLRKIAQELQLEHCLVLNYEESVLCEALQEYVSPNVENQAFVSTTPDSTPRVFIAKQGQDTAACTPAFRTAGSKKKKSHTKGNAAAHQTRLQF